MDRKLAIKNDAEYANWLKELKERYNRSRIRASVHVNGELLKFYWSLGKDISEKKADSKWGSKFYETLSKDLQKEIPNVQGFSSTNLKYIKYFYELFKDEVSTCPQLVDEFAKIPWGHIRYIIDSCKSDLICKSKDNIVAQYSLESSSVPIGISEYDLYNLLPADFKSTLPSIEEIEKELNAK